MLTYEQVYVEMCVGMGETLASAAQVHLLLRLCSGAVKALLRLSLL